MPTPERLHVSKMAVAACFQFIRGVKHVRVERTSVETLQVQVTVEPDYPREEIQHSAKILSRGFPTLRFEIVLVRAAWQEH